MNIPTFNIPEKLAFLTQKASRRKGAYGGRGAGKSWGFADSLILLALSGVERILCLRELQKSIKDSVHQLICDRIKVYELGAAFEITDQEIRALQTGSTFHFSGIKHNTGDLKSWEGATRAWVEEAEKLSQESIDILTPTIRRPGSELWFSWNTGTKYDPVFKLLVTNPPPDTICELVNYYDNPWFPEVLRKEMEHDKATDDRKYRRVWLGDPADGGPFFSNFDETACAEQPFMIPPHVGARSLYGGFDFGWGVNGWASFGMCWLDPLRVPHRLFHWYRSAMTAQEQADDLYDYIASFYHTSGVFPVEIWYDNQMDAPGSLEKAQGAPIDYFKARWRKGGKSTAWTPAIKNRVNGWQIVLDYLGKDVDTRQPKMRYWREFNAKWVESMQNVPQDPNNALDVLKCDIDHPCDETRYCWVGLKTKTVEAQIDEQDAKRNTSYAAMERKLNKMAFAETGAV